MDNKDYGEESPELLHARMIRLPFVSGTSRGPATAVEAVHAEVVADARVEERLNEHAAMIESLSAAFTRLSQIIEPPRRPVGGGSPIRPAKKNWYSVKKGLGGIRMITDSWDVAKPYCKLPGSEEFFPGIEVKGFETLDEAVRFMST